MLCQEYGSTLTAPFIPKLNLLLCNFHKCYSFAVIFAPAIEQQLYKVNPGLSISCYIMHFARWILPCVNTALWKRCCVSCKHVLVQRISHSFCCPPSEQPGRGRPNKANALYASFQECGRKPSCQGQFVSISENDDDDVAFLDCCCKQTLLSGLVLIMMCTGE